MSRSYMSRTYLSRRNVLAAGAVIGLAAAYPALAATPSAIAVLWARAERLRLRLRPHEAAMAAAFRDGGVPGWMRLRGEAYTLGETRYGLLVQILNSAPSSAADLDLQRRAARDDEMHNGPRDWARARVEIAERQLRQAA